jgi:surface antigen
MRTRLLNILFVTAAAMLVAPSIQAANLRFLNYTPITYLKAKDNASLHKAAGEVLDNKKDGEKVDWNNDGLGNATRVHAEISANNTTTVADKTCRDLNIVLHAKGQDQALTLQVCKAKAGKWELVKK